MIHAELRVERGAAQSFVAPAPAGGCLLLTDRNVEALLPAALRALPRHVLPPGESSKSWAELERVLLAMDAAGLDRDGELLAVGGGVVSDLGGLAAQLHRRGLAWSVLPTSLVAQADAALGGKTAVNLGGGKNTVGGFHPARTVLIDPNFLASLPASERSAGFAEMLKTALIAGPELFEIMEALRPQDALSPSAIFVEALEHVVATKMRLVEADLHDRAERRLLNLGHTFGHAFEALALGELRHGAAVGLGLLCAARCAGASELEARLRRVLAAWELPTALPELDLPAALRQMKRDKKRQGGALTLIVAPAPGRVEILTGASQEDALSGLRAVQNG